MSVYLICLPEADAEVLASIRDEWPRDRYEVSPTQILVERRNGGKPVYDRIEDRLDGREFPALIVRCRHYHGRQSGDLWEWLDKAS